MAKKRRTADDRDRDLHALELRRQGLNYPQIAQRMGYTNRSGAFKAVARALNDALTEVADDVRKIELERLDDLTATAQRILTTRHLVVSQGRVMLDPDTEQPLIDDGVTLAAIDRLLKIADRRARYLGLDAPTKSEVRNVDAVDAEIERLLAQLATRGTPAATGEASG